MYTLSSSSSTSLTKLHSVHEIPSVGTNYLNLFPQKRTTLSIKCSDKPNTTKTSSCINCKTQFDPSLNHVHTAHFGGENRRKFESVHEGGKSVQVKAFKGSLQRETISSHWDLSVARPPSRLPGIELLDPNSMLLRHRIVYLGFQIDKIGADFIINQLLSLDAEDSTKDITLFIHTTGGSFTSAMAIYDAMKLCEADISTTCVGVAAAMGAFLLAAGTKGKRYCMPNSRIMMRNPGGEGSGDMLKIQELNHHISTRNKILASITGKSEEQIDKDTDCDMFMNAWEAKEYGLIDTVINDGKPGLVAPIADSTPPPKAKIWHLWKPDATGEDLPSEHKLLKNGAAGSHTSDDDKGMP